MPEKPDEFRFQFLAHKWINGTITTDERRELEEWYQKDQDQEVHLPSSVAAGEEDHERRLQQAIQQKLGWETPVIPVKKHFPLRWTAAAAAVILLGLSVYLYSHTRNKPIIPPLAQQQQPAKQNIAPGRNGAILTLSNGKQIQLDSAGTGYIAKEGNAQLVAKNGQLAYLKAADAGTDPGGADQLLYNTVSTANGRQWSVTLPDGTKVWLNAASSIRYPLNFKGKLRLVEITGEAYFEVAHNAEKPFRVKVGDQFIEDIGTAFNINAYTDEGAVRTTLLQGSVRVRTKQTNNVLRPGEQATVNTDSQTISVKAVNTEEAIAWKNGFFNFQHADIRSVMRQLSRWYDVNIEYKVIPDDTFSGEIGRNLTLNQVLDLLQTAHVHFVIKDNKTINIIP